MAFLGSRAEPRASTEREPTSGARRREGLLLAGYLLALVIGVWTVVASELGVQEPASGDGEKVAVPTKNSR